MVVDQWSYGRRLYTIYRNQSEIRMIDFDNLAYYQKTTWNKTAILFQAEIIQELDPSSSCE